MTQGCVRSSAWRVGDSSAESPENKQGVTSYIIDNKTTFKEARWRNSDALVEKYKDANGKDLFEINYIEFSERGNLFDTQHSNFIKNRIKKFSDTDEGVITVAFIHGWHNNAASHNVNVRGFRSSLHHFVSENKLQIGDRKVIGLYVGWRGLVFMSKLVNAITFWDRKSVSAQIGHGGVTDLLLDLEDYDDQRKKNVLVLIGHSFGGTMLLSAYNEKLLNRVRLLAKQEDQCQYRSGADSIILLNPAVEANELLTIKEHIIKNNTKWSECTPVLMRVISSKADWATGVAFPLGQIVGTTLRWNQVQLNRPDIANAQDKVAMKYLHEYHLDTKTIGNFQPFHTLELSVNSEDKKSLEFGDLCNGDERKLGGKEIPVFPCSNFDPVQFIYTSKDFIGSHDDIFEDNKLLRNYLVRTVLRETKLREKY